MSHNHPSTITAFRKPIAFRFTFNPVDTKITALEMTLKALQGVELGEDFGSLLRYCSQWNPDHADYLDPLIEQYGQPWNISREAGAWRLSLREGVDLKVQQGRSQLRSQRSLIVRMGIRDPNQGLVLQRALSQRVSAIRYEVTVWERAVYLYGRTAEESRTMFTAISREILGYHLQVEDAGNDCKPRIYKIAPTVGMETFAVYDGRASQALGLLPEHYDRCHTRSDVLASVGILSLCLHRDNRHLPGHTERRDRIVAINDNQLPTEPFTSPSTHKTWDVDEDAEGWVDPSYDDYDPADRF